MKLVVKPKTKFGLEKIKADAFIFGMKNYSINHNFTVSIKEIKELKEKLNDKEIFISIDKNIFNKDLDNLKKILKDLEKINISGILFYDISLIYLRDELKLKTPLIWNQNYFVTNYKSLEFYKNLGISGAVISSEITLEEIKEIVENVKKLSFFINGFGYQMMGFSKRKLISNYFKFINKKDFKKKHFLVNKDGKFRIIEEDNGTAILSKYVLNYLKELNTFKKLGIKYFVLDEKELKRRSFIEALKIFNEVNNNDLSENEISILNEKINKLFNTDTGFLYKKTIYKVK